MNLCAVRMAAFGEYVEDGTASTVKQRDFKDATDLIAHTLRADGFDASEDGTGRGTPLVFDERNITSKANRSVVEAGRECHTLHESPPTVAGYFSPRVCRNSDTTNETGIKDWDDLHDTLQSDGLGAVAFQTRIARNGRGQPKETVDSLVGSDSGVHGDSKPHIAGTFGVRRLTPRECERLQGFPDDWTRWDADGNELADSPRYRMMGNAVSVPVVQWIGRRIVEAQERACQKPE